MTQQDSKLAESRRALRPAQAAPVRRSAAVTASQASTFGAIEASGAAHIPPFAGDDAE
jgi:prenylated cyclic peptide (anacyclamide/piricyclamide family)